MLRAHTQGTALLILAMMCFCAVDASQTCGSTDLISTITDYTTPAISACVRTRCLATTGTAPTTFTDGWCDGVATNEKDASCAVLEEAYSKYYSCLYTAVQGTSPATTLSSEVEMFMATSGMPYSMTNLGCYACNHFENVVIPSTANACSSWSCATCCSASPSNAYTHTYCGYGCVGSIMVACFLLLAAAMGLMCCLCWPSPSLRSTYAAMLAEEKAYHEQQQPDNM